ncbi:MAG: four helix bundle protein [Flavobacteriales bacterium]|nr:four helix bundle protein [Flavobacteriales bacterium]
MPAGQKAAELKGQSTRAAISIASNIAEGNSRRSEKDKHRFMEIALGSAFELETQSHVLMRREWAPKEKVDALLEQPSMKDRKCSWPSCTKLVDDNLTSSCQASALGYSSQATPQKARSSSLAALRYTSTVTPQESS